MHDDLERRVSALEQRTRSLPWTMLVLIVGAIAGAVIQYRMTTSLKAQVRDLQRIESVEVSHAK